MIGISPCSRDLFAPLLNKLVFVLDSLMAGHYTITRLSNTVIDNACVPAEWNLAETFPIFRRDDEFDKSKCRPVSILVLLDKVFELCVQKQLVHYFNPHLSKFLSACRKVTVVSLFRCILSRTGKELLTRILWLGL